MTSADENPKDGTGAGDDAPDSGATGKTGISGGRKADDALASAILALSKVYSESGEGGVSPQVTDAVTQALVLILGSAPSFVAFEGLLSAQNSSGLMYHNAVSNQQKTNLLGMAMTAKCVRYMLDPYPDQVIEETPLSGVAGSI